MTAVRDDRRRTADSDYHDDLVPRFHPFLRRTVPRRAEVLVVSKGDRALVEGSGVNAGHFPQRGDGVYAGYYPKTSAAAIEHLDHLKSRGAKFLAFPQTALWWLEHYSEFAQYLNDSHRLIALDEDVAALYALFTPGERQDRVAIEQPAQAPEQVAPRPRLTTSHGDHEPEFKALFDAEHYRTQAELGGVSREDAFEHYMTEGHRAGLSPHPLFDVSWYLERNPDAAGQNPLEHYILHGSGRGADPNPFFDTAYYEELAGGGASLGGTALRHYIERASRNASYHPNPLFRDGYYLRTYGDARTAGTPLEHFLRFGASGARSMSELHRQMLDQLSTSGQQQFTRGNWKVGTVLCFASSGHRAGEADIIAIADQLAERHHVDAVVVAERRSDLAGRVPTSCRLLVLEDFELAAPVLRPSARRLLARALAEFSPMFALCEDPEVLPALQRCRVGTHFLLPAAGRLHPRAALDHVFAGSVRVIAPSSDSYLRAAELLGRYPSNVATRRPDDADHSDSLLELAKRDFGVELKPPVARRGSQPDTRRVVIPCPDWGVSGVNASLQALGTELAQRGWEIEILFTRDQDWVERSVGTASLPTLPHRFLTRRSAGIEGLWEALIADLERNAPQLMLTSYDFVANGVIPALSERVGVAMWVQADDGDYYEQAYRLGRYCDAIVCVSEAIATRLAGLNPALADLTHVIPNSSIRSEEIVSQRGSRSPKLRIAYAGRLVQYQKRVLDFVALADALDATGIDYEIVLIGAFPAHTDVEDRFMASAARHLATGRIKLAGRLSHDEIMAQLDESDLYVLLSDFEGLPLSLVEAMARGCVPVAAQMESGVPEVVNAGVNGLIISGRDYETWARQIVALANDRRGLNRMSKRARATVKAQFTVDRAADKFEAALAATASLASRATARRPPALHWGSERSRSGDVLPPPSLFRPDSIQINGLRVAGGGKR